MFAGELVVARYRENLNWLRNVPSVWRITVYDKGERDLERCGEEAASPLPHLTTITLPNIGREAHTYLHHLVMRYETLAPLTVFCQGKPFDHAYDFHTTLRRLAAQNGEVSSFTPLGHLVDTDSDDGTRLFRPWSKNEDGRGLDMRGFHRALLGDDGPPLYTFRGGAQFVATRECLLRRSRAFYENALNIASTLPDAAHCFERAWPLVFGVSNPDLVWLEGRETAYLKPIKSRTFREAGRSTNANRDQA